MSKLVHLDTNSVWQLKTLQRATSIRIKKKKKSIVSVNKRSRLWRIGQKLPGLTNHNSSCFSRMHRLGCMKQTNNKTFIPWVRYCICDTLHGAVSCQGLFFSFFFLQKLILLLLRQKSFRLSLLQRGVPVESRGWDISLRLALEVPCDRICFQGEGTAHSGGDFPHQPRPLSPGSPSHCLLNITLSRLVVAAFFSRVAYFPFELPFTSLFYIWYMQIWHLLSP